MKIKLLLTVLTFGLLLACGGSNSGFSTLTGDAPLVISPWSLGHFA